MTTYRGQAKVPPYVWNPYDRIDRYPVHYGPVMTQRVNVIQVRARRYHQTYVSHGFHAVMTLLTCGFWLPVWIGCVVWSVLRDKIIMGRW